MTLPDDVRDAWIDAASRAMHEVGCCPMDVEYGGCDGPDAPDLSYAASAVDALAPLIVAYGDRRAAEALRSAADDWQFGGWAVVLTSKPFPPAVPLIAYAQRITDWLRARAAREGEA